MEGIILPTGRYVKYSFAENNHTEGKQNGFTYDDSTCDYSCKVTEFVYLATAAYLGSDEDLASDEMILKTRTALNETIPIVVQFFESDEYVYPTDHWSDGTYPHVEKITSFGVQ